MLSKIPVNLGKMGKGDLDEGILGAEIKAKPN